jgi:carbonic anhydrase
VQSRLARLALASLCLSLPSALEAAQAAPESPAAALERLKAGNERFVADPAGSLPIGPERRSALVSGQSPFAMVLSCADSRVPPEIVFNTGLGDLFVVRAAGQVLDRSVLASLEYGAEHLHIPMLVIMGHEFCGAVKTAVDSAAATTRTSHGPNIDYLIKAIQPAVARSAKSLFDDPVRAAVLANVEQEVSDIQVQSAVLKRAVDAGKLQVVGAFYELGSGRVVFAQPVGSGPRPAGTARAERPAPATRAAHAPAAPHP